MENLHDACQYCRRGRLAGITGSHVWPVQLFEQGERAAFLVRQHLIGNLYTRISTRPFLSHVEKVRSSLHCELEHPVFLAKPATPVL